MNGEEKDLALLTAGFDNGPLLKDCDQDDQQHT